MNFSAKINVLILLSCLAACSNHSPAPVDDIRFAHKNKNHSALKNTFYKQEKLNQIDHHKVLPGETLFAIAWRYSLDYHSIAKLNALKAFRIYPGQELLLRKIEVRSIYSAPSLIAAINTDILHKNKTSIKLNSYSKVSQLKTVELNHSNKPSNLSVNSIEPTKTQKQYRARTTDNKIDHWIWPANGKVVEGFSAKQNQNKGLDIKGKKGSAVRATASGKVVYSGSGLKGYGRLVIIKHNDSYLSAYAHNNKIHVIENEVVKAGQRIADLGKSGADFFKLHFEIRYKGKPVNPLNYLPKAG